MTTQYEMMMLTSAELEPEQRQTIIDRAKDAITKGGGTWERVDDWGRRKMAYEINHIRDAHYHLAFFECDGDATDEAVRVLRITDGVIRAMAVHRVPDLPAETRLPSNEDEPPKIDDRGGRRGGRGGRSDRR